MGDDETVTIETTEVDTENVEETVTVSTDLEGGKQGKRELGGGGREWHENKNFPLPNLQFINRFL